MMKRRFSQRSWGYRWGLPILMAIGLYTALGLAAWGLSSFIESTKGFQESSTLADIVRQQNDIDDQYDRVIDGLPDLDNYPMLRDMIDQCMTTVNEYNSLRGPHWPAMSPARCDRIFP